MYCRNCGKDVAENTKECLNCGADPSVHGAFCFECGAKVHSSAKKCKKCGATFNLGDTANKSSIITISGVLMIIAAAIFFMNAIYYIYFFIIYIFIILFLTFLALFTSGITLIPALIYFLLLPLILVFFVITAVCGLIELLYGIKLMRKNIKRNPFWVGIMEIVIGLFIFKPIILGFGIAHLVMLLGPEAKEYFYQNK